MNSFKARTNDGMVSVLGRRLSENFALTIPVRDMGDANGKPQIITHIPSGMCAYKPHYVSRAKAIATALEAMPVDWSDDDEGRVVSACNTYLASIDSCSNKFFEDLDEPHKERVNPKDNPRLAKLLKTRAWKGAKVFAAETYGDRERVIVAQLGKAEAVFKVSDEEYAAFEGERR